MLVSTTIIESGLDIPNANTLIVDRADWFGLAQLYQLRGRVGRGANRPTPTFFHPQSSRLTAESARRACRRSIGEQTDLGAGMSIAMRDLEIRGAGDLLGTRQSGHIAAVGFHLYCRLLAQAVSELKGEAPRILTAGTPSVSAGTGFGGPDCAAARCFLASRLCCGRGAALHLYRRLSTLTAVDEVASVEAELKDRFGPLPEPALNLLYQLRIKIAAQGARVQAVVAEHRQLVIRVEAIEYINRTALQQALGDRIRVGRREIRLPLGPEPVWRAELGAVLHRLREAVVALPV